LLSNSRVTRIGELLKDGKEDAGILTELEQYRSEFAPAYEHVASILTENMGLKVSGRFKSTISIVEKLKRGSIRLPQIQDIAGCRVIAVSLTHQNQIVEQIQFWFPGAKVHDKRSMPAHGYRAIHVLVQHQDRTVEIQIRTQLQHFWANRSEKLADRYGQEIKYGHGNEGVVQALTALSDDLAHLDSVSEQLGFVTGRINAFGSHVPKGDWKVLNTRRRMLAKDFDGTARRIGRRLKQS